MDKIQAMFETESKTAALMKMKASGMPPPRSTKRSNTNDTEISNLIP
jgi:hypothetical protein